MVQPLRNLPSNFVVKPSVTLRMWFAVSCTRIADRVVRVVGQEHREVGLTNLLRRAGRVVRRRAVEGGSAGRGDRIRGRD